MTSYIIRRLLLLPLTLFAIILVNFVIINLAPGDPVMRAEISSTGEASRSTEQQNGRGDTHYLQFREHYGLTLPILFNTWPSLSEENVDQALKTLANPPEDLSIQKYTQLRTLWGDRAPFILPLLLEAANDTYRSQDERRIAANLFIRGSTRQGHVGSKISADEKQENRQIARDNAFLLGQRIYDYDSLETLSKKIDALDTWATSTGALKDYPLSAGQKFKIFFFKTRFFRYLSRVVTLDFGSLRNDANKSVIHEVGKRLKYSLTLAVLPMLVTFALCQVFGMMMAVKHNRWQDITLNVSFLILFAIPIFVVAPFLIEKVALHHTIPFTNMAIPFSGFHSREEIYATLTSSQRLFDITIHIFLPLVAIMYGTLAVQARLSRTAVLEVLRQDYVRTARAKGLPKRTILVKHVGRNAAITIVTSLAASLGVVLGGSLIVETVFEINGFGRFFYEAILNRDYNVVLFSAFAGAFLTLIGYLIADIAYTLLDPRVSLER